MNVLWDPGIDLFVDATTKGIPVTASPLRLSEIGQQRWNILAGHCPLPVAVLREDLLQANSRWMAQFARLNGLLLAPHGKTTMAPALFRRQLMDGAWAITVATSQQLQVAVRAGARRVVLANQPVGHAVDACFAALRIYADLELFVLADSIAGVAQLAAGVKRARQGSPLRVLVELGVPGGRIGCRDSESALSVARAVAGSSGLRLAGIEAFEGVLPDAAGADALLARVVEVARTADEEGLFTEQIVLSAGGSAYFDLVARALKSVRLSQTTIGVLRSGCYLVHDDFRYGRAFERMLRERQVPMPAGQLRSALEIWSYVQSVPEAGLALLTLGKRDVGYDYDLPRVVSWFRPGAMSRPEPGSPECKLTALNDQHAYLAVPSESLFMVGDMVAVAISHPCTTFDRWQVVLLVNERLEVTGAVRTCF